MIHTKELRYGNKVQTRQGETITVQQILSNTVIYDAQIELNREAVNFRGSSDTDYVIQLNEVIKEADFQEIYPIALTPEILKKCGFRNFIRDEWIVRIGSAHIDFEFINDGLRLRRPAPSFTNIKYLHQLQNLLFLLSEHELEVEL